MARKKSSPAEDFIELVSYLPWWAGIALAVVSYFVLHYLATPDPVGPMSPNQMGAFVARSLWKAIAFTAQFAVPVLCVIAAIVSGWRRHQRKSLVEDVAQAKSTNALDGMSWREFEMLVGEAFRLNGLSVVEKGGGGADV